MKFNFALIFSLVLAVGLVSLAFTISQSSSEKERLAGELEAKTIRVSEDFYKSYLKDLSKGDSINLKKITNRTIEQHRLLGIAIYYTPDSIIAVDSSVRDFIPSSLDYIAQAISADSSMGNIIRVNGKNVYEYIKLFPANSAIVFYTDASYIQNLIQAIWLRNFMRWFIQAMVVSLITVLIIRWSIFTPINRILLWVKAARAGNVSEIKSPTPSSFLSPLYQEITQIAHAMHEAKAMASEEARLRTTSEAIWTPERLKEEVKKIVGNKMMVVVSNREPYMHIHAGKETKLIKPASGLITAMEPILNACGGLWVASGSGDADKETVDAHDKVKVPPEDPKYTLRRIWLTKEEENHFYYGFSNEGLWPLCHIAHTRPIFRKEDWDDYKKVNEIYARAVIEEIKDETEPFILVQDYHFTLLPQLIKKARPDARVAIFWHIPWPNAESFGICPWQKEILDGMLGADLIGFHTQYHCNNFLETVSNALESRIAWENFSVRIGDHTTLVKPFPISIAFTLKDFDNKQLPNTTAVELLKEQGISAEFMGIGVDRIDYTKGIIEKFFAIERFLEKYPEYEGRFTFVQIGAPSRTLLKSYSDLVNEVEIVADRINWKFKSKNWKPILLLKRHHDHEEIIPYYQCAHVCMVNSLHDGMNLVAKEFIASRNQDNGTLILSRFAGASQELNGATIVNPYDIEQTADAIKYCLEMPEEDQRHRMRHMREVIVGHNIYFWAANLIRTMSTIPR
ncbi:MAG: trehalose-6-phosphate synthase [Chitinophagaceae bacterium]